MENKIQRALEEILFEKQDEIRRLEAENEQLRIQCRNAEQWRKECVGKKECEVLRLEAQVKELQAKVTELDIAKSQLEIDVDTYNNLVDRMVEQKRALQERIAALEKQCSEYGSDALQTSCQLASANELLELESKEKETLKAENERLKAQVKELQSAEIRDGNAYVDHLFKVIAAERKEREYREKQVAELQGRIADLQRISDDEFP